MLRDSVVVVVVRARPQALLLAMTSMRKSTQGFPFLFYMSKGLRLAALRLPELRYHVIQRRLALRAEERILQ